MKLIQGDERKKLEEMLKQLRLHGNGGGSPALAEAFAKFQVTNKHDLAIKLIERLLGFGVNHCGGGGY